MFSGFLRADRDRAIDGDDDDAASALAGDSPHREVGIDDDADGPVDEFDTDHFADVEWAPEHGFPDPWGVALVWLDDQGELINRVRLSLQWRQRLGSVPLTAAFQQIFLLINNYVEATEVIDPEIDEPDEVPAMSWQALTDLRERAAELTAQIDALPDEVRGHPEEVWVTGRGAKGKVLLTLNHDGGPGHVNFDETWLKTARVKQICDGVVEAHKDARAHWSPPAWVRSPRDDLIDQLSGTRNQLVAMLRRGLA